MHYVYREDFLYQKEKINKLVEKNLIEAKEIYLSICLDAFSSKIAPGVSAPQVLGLEYWETQPLLEKIIKSQKLIGIDLVELAPCYDQDEKTAQLAAKIIYNFLSFYSK